MNQVFTDETLVAFADGELDDATADAIATAIKTDAELETRVEIFMATRDLLRSELGGIATAPVPERLTRAAMGLRPQDAAAAVRPQRFARIALPMAAAVAGIMIGAGAYGLLQPSGPATSAPFALLADAGLQGALSQVSDGAAAALGEGRVTLRETYRTRAGFCRSFGLEAKAAEAGRFSGLACRAEAGWRVELVAADHEGNGSYAPASGVTTPADAFLSGAEASDALDGAAVRALIEKGWR